MKRGDVHMDDWALDFSKLNFNDHSSRVASVKITNIIIIVLVVIIVILRLYSRLMIMRKTFLEDVLIVFAAIFTVALAGMSIASTNYGVGTHIWLLPFISIVPIIKKCILCLYVCQVLYSCAIATTKLAIVACYFRLIIDTTYRNVLYGVTVIIIALWITGVFVTIFQCNPADDAWNFDRPNRQCINYIHYLYASSAINITTDILLCIIPIPHLWALKLPMRQRVLLCVLFMGGIGACIACCVRIAYIHDLEQADGPFESALPLNLSVVECGLGIICISISTLRPLGRRLFPHRPHSTLSPHRPSDKVAGNRKIPHVDDAVGTETAGTDTLQCSKGSHPQSPLPDDQV